MAVWAIEPTLVRAGRSAAAQDLLQRAGEVGDRLRVGRRRDLRVAADAGVLDAVLDPSPGDTSGTLAVRGRRREAGGDDEPADRVVGGDGGVEAGAPEGARDLGPLLGGEVAVGQRLGGALGGERLAQSLVLVHDAVWVDRPGVARRPRARDGDLPRLLDVLHRAERIEPEALPRGAARLLGEPRDRLAADLEVLAAEVDEG